MKKYTFRKWAYDKGYTMAQLARMIPIDRVTLYFWIKGERRPHPRNMNKVKVLTEGLFKNPEDLID